MRNLLIGLLVLTLLGCSSSPKIIYFDASQSSSGDWLPIPADAPTEVEVTDIAIAKSGVVIDANQVEEVTDQLEISQQRDSIGNTSLLVNRPAALSWVLVEAAFAELDYTVNDKNLESYRFELQPEVKSKGLWAALFGKQPDLLNVVLIPQINGTLIVVEGEGDELPDMDRAERILLDLQEQMQQ